MLLDEEGEMVLWTVLCLCCTGLPSLLGLGEALSRLSSSTARMQSCWVEIRFPLKQVTEMPNGV